jgi:hypothetical protein
MIYKGDYKFWMHDYYRKNLDLLLNEAMPNNWDGFGIIFGMEGAGKSTIGTQSAIYCDEKFNIDKCAFLPNQYEEAMDKSPPESSILWDEAITGANAAQHASKIQSSVISKLTQIRKKKLKSFICFPYLYMLRRYFIERATFGIYVYAKDFNDRGHAYFYSQPKLIKLYNTMKKREDNQLMAVKSCWKSFYFSYPKTFCLPEKEYDNKKENARIINEREGKDNLWKNRTGILFNELNKNHGYTYQRVADMFNINKVTLVQAMKGLGGR